MLAKEINSRSFKPYGKVIEYPNKSSKRRKFNLFRIVLTEPRPKGWRIAYLVVRDKVLKRLESHPDSFESFEPIKGKSFLFVASRNMPNNIQCFRLNLPIILKKGIWHGVVTLGQESEIKITEDAKVKCVYWHLGMILK